jgi:hypothetical protein
MYAVGRKHPLRNEARLFFEENLERKSRLVTSSEVLQELMHAYIPVKRIATLDAALTLAASSVGAVWPVEREDIAFARVLLDRHPELGARDLLHLACCKRREIPGIKTYDRTLEAAFHA